MPLILFFILYTSMFKKEVNENVELTESIFAKISVFVIQIFKKNESRILPLGSGILLKKGDTYYIMSAKHNFEDIDKSKVGFYVNKEFQTIQLTNSFSSGNDIISYRLDDILIEKLKENDYKFFSHDQISYNNTFRDDFRYYMIGYPESQNKIKWNTGELLEKPFEYVTQKKNNSFIDGDEIELEFHRRKLLTTKNECKQIAPLPYGNSGCGLWSYEEDKLTLVGIMVRFNNVNASFIVEKIKGVE